MEKQRILIVDDDENIAELISLYLLKECFATEIAYTGKDALALAATFNPDLILLDIMLPDIDGYEVCTEIPWHAPRNPARQTTTRPDIHFLSVLCLLPIFHCSYSILLSPQITA